MNITWGFINASQQTAEIMKEQSGSGRRRLLELLHLLCFLSISCQRRRLSDHSSAGFRQEKPGEAAEHRGRDMSNRNELS